LLALLVPAFVFIRVDTALCMHRIEQALELTSLIHCCSTYAGMTGEWAGMTKTKFCRRVGIAHHCPGVNAFALVGGACPAKNIPE